MVKKVSKQKHFSVINKNSNWARSNTQNSRKWLNMQNFSTTSIPPKKGYIRIRQVPKRSLEMINLILST